MAVPPGPVLVLLGALQASEFTIVAMLLRQVDAIGSIFARVPAVIIAMRLVVDADSRGTRDRTSQNDQEHEGSELSAHEFLLM
jgi:hypothetical protein